MIVYSPQLPETVNFKVDDISNKTIVSPQDIEITDSKNTVEYARLKSKLEAESDSIYSIDPKTTDAVLDDLTNTFDLLETYRIAYSQNHSAPVPSVLSFIPQKMIQRVQTMPASELATIRVSTLDQAEKILSPGLRFVDPSRIRSNVISASEETKAPGYRQDMIIEFLLHSIRPNLLPDPEKTEASLQKKLTELHQLTFVREGQPIIYRGDRVTPDHIKILTELNMYGRKANIEAYFGIFLSAVLLAILVERFVSVFYPKISQRPKYFLLMLLVTILLVVMARLIHNVTLFDERLAFQFLIPISLAAFILSVTVTPNISMLVGTIIAGLIAMMYGNDFSLFFYLFLSNCATTFLIYRKYKLSELTISGYWIGIVNLVLVIVLGITSNVHDPMWFVYNGGLGVANGLLSAMLSLAVLPYFESLFNITTPQRLLEQSNLNHPLLKRLMVTAPGTYHHSLMVANLAEAAAEAIGADVVLSRIGAYFHDVGKIKRPNFFAENQFSGENPHHNLSAKMSKQIIVAHPKDGVELANKYRLPDVLKEFMMEHHGTSLVSFFYTQALQKKSNDPDDDDDITEESYRYPGPKPHFKESGILMLADSVEASVRSMDKPTMPKIEALVDRIFKDKIDDGQLSDCPLSLKEIQIIRQTFLRILQGIYHHRVDYKTELNAMIKSEPPKDTPS